MEAKLREYRALRRRKELEQKETEGKELNIFPHDMIKEKQEDAVLLISPEEKDEINEIQTLELASETSEVESVVDETEETWRYSITKWSIYFIIWLSLYIIFLKLKFGAVYFVISVLIVICLNTRTRPRREGEMSPYSVFNENCESIEGTLDAEQFEREIRYGPGSVR